MKKIVFVMALLCAMQPDFTMLVMAYEFTSPLDSEEFGRNANVSFSGNQGTSLDAFTVKIKKNGVTESSEGGTCGIFGFWSGTVDAPQGGFSDDNGTAGHQIIVYDGNNHEEDVVDIEFVTLP